MHRIGIRLGWIALLVMVFHSAYGQSDLLQAGSYGQFLIDRYEVKSGSLDSLSTVFKPYYRHEISIHLNDSAKAGIYQSKADRFNREWLSFDNLPYTAGDTGIYSERKTLRYFYPSPANFTQVNTSGFNLYANPVLFLEGGFEQGEELERYVNTRGVELRGNIDDIFGFYSLITENQARYPNFIQDVIDQTSAIPGQGFWKNFKEEGYDYFSVRGYFTARLSRHIRLQFGQDRNFIGQGIRSMVLGDYAKDYLFLKLNTQVWKFNYQNLFAEMTYTDGAYNRPLQSPYLKKYMAMHYLSIDLRHNLRIGLFEKVMFYDNDGLGRNFEFAYLNPVIFYRAVEHSLGDNDNMSVGTDFYYLPVPGFALYGQFVLGEFLLREILAREGWWGNKWGYQLGVKAVDFLGLPNLDLSAEYNAMRPYMYAHKFDGTAYTHFSHPLAHPLGANFQEVLGRVTYQPLPRLLLEGSLLYYQQGRDRPGENWGSNINRDPNTRVRNRGNFIGQGELTQVAFADFLASYQVRHNYWLDLRAYQRVARSDTGLYNSDSRYFSLGLRVNFQRERHMF